MIKRVSKQNYSMGICATNIVARRASGAAPPAKTV